MRVHVTCMFITDCTTLMSLFTLSEEDTQLNVFISERLYLCVSVRDDIIIADCSQFTGEELSFPFAHLEMRGSLTGSENSTMKVLLNEHEHTHRH